LLSRPFAPTALHRPSPQLPDRTPLPTPTEPKPADRFRLRVPLQTDMISGSNSALPHSARVCARQIAEAFAQYNAEFRAITRRAPVKFDARDWKESQRDAVERIELYDRFVDRTIAEVRLGLGECALEREIWRQIRHEFAKIIPGLPDPE